MSISMATPTSESNTSDFFILPSGNRSNLRDASFSSYLNKAEETFILELAGSGTSLSSTSIQDQHVYLGRKKAEDKEIDVFAAEKYFNEGPNDTLSNEFQAHRQHMKDTPLEMFPTRQNKHGTTPSVHSDSSWNSRSALLHRNQQPRKTNKKSILASLSCNCACNDRNSIDIDVNTGDDSSNKSTRNGLASFKTNQAAKTGNMVSVKEEWQHKIYHEPDERFSFPVYNSKITNPMKVQETEDLAKRKSLEVFGSPAPEKAEDNTFVLEKSLAMLNWDAISQKVEEIEIPESHNEMCDEDSESDASSDLFEIESLTRNLNPFLSGQQSDGCITPTTCYAPSEASIEWSVITASAADFSVLSDSEDVRSTTTGTSASFKHPRIFVKEKSTLGKEATKRRQGILSGCKSHKAVRVAGDAYRTNEKGFPNARRLYKQESFTPMTRFHAENKLEGFGARK